LRLAAFASAAELVFEGFRGFVEDAFFLRLVYEFIHAALVLIVVRARVFTADFLPSGSLLPIRVVPNLIVSVSVAPIFFGHARPPSHRLCHRTRRGACETFVAPPSAPLGLLVGGYWLLVFLFANNQ
jgi:hypothetical protein